MTLPWNDRIVFNMAVTKRTENYCALEQRWSMVTGVSVTTTTVNRRLLRP